MENIVYKLSILLVGFCIVYVTMCLCNRKSFNEHFLEKSKCPACFGQTMCKDISLDNSKYILNQSLWDITELIDVRNVHLGSIGSQKVVFKRLGQNWELDRFDNIICESLNQRIVRTEKNRHCNPGLAIEMLLQYYNGSVNSFIRNEPTLFENSDVIQCVDSWDVINYLLEYFQRHHSDENRKEYFLTLLSINPEPLVLMVSEIKLFRALYKGLNLKQFVLCIVLSVAIHLHKQITLYRYPKK